MPGSFSASNRAVSQYTYGPAQAAQKRSSPTTGRTLLATGRSRVQLHDDKRPLLQPRGVGQNGAASEMLENVSKKQNAADSPPWTMVSQFRGPQGVGASSIHPTAGSVGTGDVISMALNAINQQQVDTPLVRLN